MTKPDPIERARQALGVQQPPQKTAPAPVDAKPAQHPMKPFQADDGVIYERRADISLALWRRHVNEPLMFQTDEYLWGGLFMGLIPETVLDHPVEERRALAEQSIVATGWTTDQWFAIYKALIEDIMMPNAPKSNASGGGVSSENGEPINPKTQPAGS